MDNPYLEAYRKLYPPETDVLGFWERFAWGIAKFGSPEAFQAAYDPPQRELRAKYAWAVPSEEAIAAIAEWSPLVEIGAGTGYWAWLLRQAGADVIAYDLAPSGSTDADGNANRYHGPNTPFTKLLRGTAEVARVHRDRTLMLCWPAREVPMASEALEAHTGSRVVHIGARGLTGDAAFHDRLASDYALTRVIDLPQWWIPTRDRVEFWERRAPE